MMRFAKSVLKRIPGVNAAAHAYRESALRRALSKRTAESLFTDYYLSNEWGGCTSRSGPGSEFELTADFRDKLPDIWRKLAVRSILDIPCGDFAWMRNVNLEGFCYSGADVVRQVVERNIHEYMRDGISFRHLDLLVAPLPHSDLVFCRDCLVHFSFKDIARAFTNIRDSGAQWLMTTQFPRTEVNADIATGQWRPLNFLHPPFNFPPPHAILQEVSDPAFHKLEYKWRATDPERVKWLARWRDKSIAVWDINDLRRVNS